MQTKIAGILIVALFSLHAGAKNDCMSAYQSLRQQEIGRVKAKAQATQNFIDEDLKTAAGCTGALCLLGVGVPALIGVGFVAAGAGLHLARLNGDLEWVKARYFADEILLLQQMGTFDENTFLMSKPLKRFFKNSKTLKRRYPDLTVGYRSLKRAIEEGLMCIDTNAPLTIREIKHNLARGNFDEMIAGIDKKDNQIGFAQQAATVSAPSYPNPGLGSGQVPVYYVPSVVQPPQWGEKAAF